MPAWSALPLPDPSASAPSGQPGPELFRRAMGAFATGVTVVTTLDAGRPRGITVNSLCLVSVDPPLLLIGLDRRRSLTPVIARSRRFAINVLGEGQEAVSSWFAGSAPGERASFCDAPWHRGAAGLPLLDGAIAALECVVVDTRPAGDHEMFIARVEAVSTDEAEPGSAFDPQPLLYHRSRYARAARDGVEPCAAGPPAADAPAAPCAPGSPRRAIP
jgi:(E)-2-((N-methylformamido)methylene)succinate hydrolase